MARAMWKGEIIADSDEFEQVEGNVYFPREAVADAHLEPSDHHTVCAWKGTASYYHVVVDGEVNENAAWCYPDPQPQAESIRGHIAFWKGVEVVP